MSPQSHRRRNDPVTLQSAQVEDLAADWLARREAGLSVEEQEEFSRWLLADSNHARVVATLEKTWRRLQRPRFSGQAEEVMREIEARVGRHARRSRRRILAGAFVTALAAAAAVAVAFFPRNPISVPRDGSIAAVADKPEQRILADGSVVELNAGARIMVDFSGERRLVRLMRGEAHFAVARDAGRPFVVSAGTVAVRAVGTEFAVQFTASTVNVLVTEGRVAVERSDGEPGGTPPVGDAPSSSRPGPAVTYLDAGNHISVSVETSSPLEPMPMSAAEARAALAWRGMRVEFADTPLAEAVERFNRRNRVKLTLGSAELGDIRISGFFWADDPEGFSRLIEASAGLRADRSAPDRITFSR